MDGQRHVTENVFRKSDIPGASSSAPAKPNRASKSWSTAPPSSIHD